MNSSPVLLVTDKVLGLKPPVPAWATASPAATLHPRHFALFALLIALFPSLGTAGTWVPFGPQTYVRGTGAAVTVTNSFSLLNPSTQYTLHIVNGGLGDSTTELASASIITINGVEVVGPNNFNRSITVLDVPVILQFSNTISVQVKGKPGGVISVRIIGVDNDPPIISASLSPLPNPAGWNNSSVTVSFTCSDKTSGVAFCPPPVAVTMEGANQVVSGTATDLAGNTATTSVTVNLDMTPPTISGTINPPPDAAGWNSSSVTVNFSCSDALSGVASCSSPVAVTPESAGQVERAPATDAAGNPATASVTVNISRAFFTVRNYAGKCLDYGVAPNGSSATVFLNDCASVHLIRVEEINDHHEVVLHAGTSVIGIHNPPVNTQGGPPPPTQTEYALELQSYHPILATTGNQLLAMDAASIIIARSRACISRDPPILCPPPPLPLLPLSAQRVVQVQYARGANGSPLVAGLRNLADSEFWDFIAIDGSGKDPTSGFVRAGYPGDLATAYDTLLSRFLPINGSYCQNASPACQPPSPAGPGTVIQIYPGTDINLTGLGALQIPPGVTIRGGRRGTLFGPLLHLDNALAVPTPVMLEISGDEVRITGLRLQGQSRSGEENQPHSFGVIAHDDRYVDSIIDHNDISDWTNVGVEVDGSDPAPINSLLGPQILACDMDPSGINLQLKDPTTRVHKTFVVRNFIHHHQRQAGGYGVESHFGG